jgi:hypothetical protein
MIVWCSRHQRCTGTYQDLDISTWPCVSTVPECAVPLMAPTHTNTYKYIQIHNNTYQHHMILHQSTNEYGLEYKTTLDNHTYECPCHVPWAFRMVDIIIYDRLLCMCMCMCMQHAAHMMRVSTIHHTFHEKEEPSADEEHLTKIDVRTPDSDSYRHTSGHILVG